MKELPSIVLGIVVSALLLLSLYISQQTQYSNPVENSTQETIPQPTETRLTSIPPHLKNEKLTIESPLGDKNLVRTRATVQTYINGIITAQLDNGLLKNLSLGRASIGQADFTLGSDGALKSISVEFNRKDLLPLLSEGERVELVYEKKNEQVKNLIVEEFIFLEK